ncbi:MAG TPA: SGNH/GDSL hydrolase family protein [Arthrobacter sp.]
MNLLAHGFAIAVCLLVLAAGCSGPPSASGTATTARTEAGPSSGAAYHRPSAASSVALLADSTRDWNVVILGDSTGDDLDEFPFLAAEQLRSAHGRTVSVHRWMDGKGYSGEFTASGGNAQIHIWNGSVAGTTATYGASNLAAMAPAGADLVIVNYGHNYADPSQAKDGVSRLLEKIDERFGTPPVLVVIQNPRNPETPQSLAVVEQLRALAATRGYEVVDVYKAFKETGDVRPLLLDDIHPSPAGSRLWAETLMKWLS